MVASPQVDTARVARRQADKAHQVTHLQSFARLWDMPKSCDIRHFSQANPAGPKQNDVPALLRRVAKSVEELGEVGVQDIVFRTEVTEDGPWHSLTVYFHYASDAEPRPLRVVDDTPS